MMIPQSFFVLFRADSSRFVIRSLFLLSLTSLSVATNAQTKPSPNQDQGIASIQTYVRQVDAFIKLNKNRHRVFVDVEPGDDKKPDHWEEFKTAAKRKSLDDENAYDEVAFVWLKKGKLVAANFTFQSGSGDWAHFVNYYFRDDGSLAKIHTRLNTFYGDTTVEQDRYYSYDGKLVRSSTRYFDLQSHRPLRRKPNFQDEPIPDYKTVKDLPFYRIL